MEYLYQLGTVDIGIVKSGTILFDRQPNRGSVNGIRNDCPLGRFDNLRKTGQIDSVEDT